MGLLEVAADSTPATGFGSAEIITLIIAVITATGASFVTALATRPKVSAEAKQANAGADVAISADAREWAKAFKQQADEATARAQAAEEKAEEAERRCEGMEQRLGLLIDYTVTLQMQVQRLGGSPAEPPPGLRPPL